MSGPSLFPPVMRAPDICPRVVIIQSLIAGVVGWAPLAVSWKGRELETDASVRQRYVRSRSRFHEVRLQRDAVISDIYRFGH